MTENHEVNETEPSHLILEAQEPLGDEHNRDGSGTDRHKRKASKPMMINQFTMRNPNWAYVNLRQTTLTTLRSAGENPQVPIASLDPITIHLQLQAALRQFLGLHGTAIPVDILKIEGHDVWTRVPREDASAVVAAVGGWVGKSGEGWRVKGWNCWGPKAGNGADLFEEG